MNLTEKQVYNLKFTLRHLDPEGKIYTYKKQRRFPRIKKHVIDLIIISKRVSRRNLTAIRNSFYQRFGEHEMDITIDDGTFQDPELAAYFKKAKEL